MVKSGNKSKRNGGLGMSPSHLMHRALQLSLDIYADETGSDGLTQRQFAVLEAVSMKSGLTQTDLVRATGIDRSTLADLVARMIGKGLLGRQRSTSDARANTVTLTADGRAALDGAGPKVAAADARILKLLPARKRDAFLSVLRDIGQAEAEYEVAVAEPKPKKKKKAKAEKAAKLKAMKPAKAAKPPKKMKKAKKAAPAVVPA